MFMVRFACQAARYPADENFDELVHDNFKFTYLRNLKKVADVLLNLEDIIIPIQSNWRNDKNISKDEER